MSQSVSSYEDVYREIGSKAWTALSWALHNGWVRDYKWYFSEIAGRDLGTPTTVKLMLQFSGFMKEAGAFFTYSDEPERLDYEKVGTRGLFMFADRVEPKRAPQFYQRLVEGHLLGTDFISPLKSHLLADADGASPLEGELRRYWAQRFDRAPKDVQVTAAALEDYCGTYGLDAAERFAARLHI